MDAVEHKAAEGRAGSASRSRALYVTFSLDGKLCALDACGIERIIPTLPWREIPGAPRAVVGVFEHHGVIVPVVDLTLAVASRPSRQVLSTRIIITRLDGGRLLGLLAEEVTETVELAHDALRASGVKSREAPYLGELFKHPDGRLIQCVHPARVLPAEVLDSLEIKAREDREEAGA